MKTAQTLTFQLKRIAFQSQCYNILFRYMCLSIYLSIYVCQNQKYYINPCGEIACIITSPIQSPEICRQTIIIITIIITIIIMMMVIIKYIRTTKIQEMHIIQEYIHLYSAINNAINI